MLPIDGKVGSMYVQLWIFLLVMFSNKIIVNVCVNVSRTSYRQATDRLPTHYQQSANRFFGELFFTITDHYQYL